MRKTVYFIVHFGILMLFLLLAACNPQAPTWQEQYNMGLRYLEEGNYEEAIIAFTAAIEIDPKQAPAYVGRGDAYIQLGEAKENLTAAQADYEKAIELDEMLAEAYLGLANVYIHQEEYEKAQKILLDGVEVTSSQDIMNILDELEKRQDDFSKNQANSEEQNWWEGTDNCTYEYDGQQVTIIYEERGIFDSITYTMENRDNTVYATAALDSIPATTPGELSTPFVESWLVTEVNSGGCYVTSHHFDQNGNEIL